MVGSISSETTLCDQFGRLRALADDWDGQGAVAPNSETIIKAERWLALLSQQRWPEPARVYSLSTGEVIAEWDHGSAHFEIEFASAGRMSWMSSGSTKQTVQGSKWDENAVFELAATFAPSVIPQSANGLELRVLQAFIGDCVRRQMAATTEASTLAP